MFGAEHLNFTYNDIRDVAYCKQIYSEQNRLVSIYHLKALEFSSDRNSACLPC